MKVTKKGEYALKFLLALASSYPDKTVSLREISQTEKLPAKFLEQISMILKRSGFITSIKGKHGGYSLSRPPEKIYLGEIIRAIDGPLAPLASAAEIQRKIHKEERHPGLYAILLDVRNAISDILDKKTLADVCDKSLEMNRTRSGSSMYYI
jgi:Rrf2 family transcriptional regulator, cysteine metabolism repressor